MTLPMARRAGVLQDRKLIWDLVLRLEQIRRCIAQKKWFWIVVRLIHENERHRCRT